MASQHLTLFFGEDELCGLVTGLMSLQKRSPEEFYHGLSASVRIEGTEQVQAASWAICSWATHPQSPQRRATEPQPLVSLCAKKWLWGLEAVFG